MRHPFALRAGAAALAAATLFGCATHHEPPLVAVTTHSSSSATSTLTTPTGDVLTHEQAAAIVAGADRTPADRNNDVRRHPVDMLMFIAPQTGWKALDISTGGGYTTELLARAIGPTGQVWGQSPPPAAGSTRRPTGEVLAERSARMQGAGVAAAPIAWAGLPFDNPVPAEAAGKLDLVTLMFNYHDFGYMGVDRAAMNRAVFAGLKHGGLFVIADHSGRPGTGISEASTLHRIEESFLRAEVEAAGFKLLGKGDFLRNPADPRDQANPSGPKDEFVLKFVKP